MKRILLLAIVGINSLVGSYSLEAKSGLKDASPAISLKELISPRKGVEHVDNLPSRPVAKFEVDYIVDENDKNYVIFIKSEHPEFNHKIIQMIKQMPVQADRKDRINKLVIEYEL